MSRALIVLSTLLLFAGCLGEGDLGPPPVADFKIRSIDGSLVRWTFDATTSTGRIVSYQWNLGEGDEPRSPIVNKTFRLRDFLYNITLVVADEHGRRSLAVRPLQVGEFRNSPPEIAFARSERWVAPGTPIVLNASASHDGDQDPMRLDWWLTPWPAPAATWPDLEVAPEREASLKLEQVGAHYYRCRDHPWVQGRVDVQEGAPAHADVAMQNFRSPGSVSVAPGGDVAFHNVDPVAHNVTLERFVPGRHVGTGTALRLASLPPGDHQVWLTAQDAKGAYVAAARGLRVSLDAPRIAWVNSTSEEPLAPHDGTRSRMIGDIGFRTTTNARLHFEPTPLVGAEVSLTIVRADGGQEASKSCTTSPCELSSVLYPGSYAFEFGVTDGRIDSWGLGATFRIFSEPPFGTYPTSGSGDGHDHEH